MGRPLILLSNDDGYAADGLRSLGACLSAHADVVVCAPETEQSTTSHALTLTHPLRLRCVRDRVFAVDGTPADCVCVALHAGTRVLPRRPDLVIAGLNHGLNLGTDIFYSGTVAAAREGALRGVPAVAASADPEADREEAARVCAEIALRFAARSRTSSLPVAPILNINVPQGRAWTVVATCLGLRLYDDIVEFRRDPRGREYLWLGGGGVRHGDVPGSDTEAYDRGDVSVTPLLLDLTAVGQADLVRDLVAPAGT